MITSLHSRSHARADRQVTYVYAFSAHIDPTEDFVFVEFYDVCMVQRRRKSEYQTLQTDVKPRGGISGELQYHTLNCYHMWKRTGTSLEITTTQTTCYTATRKKDDFMWKSSNRS